MGLFGSQVEVNQGDRIVACGSVEVGAFQLPAKLGIIFYMVVQLIRELKDCRNVNGFVA